MSLANPLRAQNPVELRVEILGFEDCPKLPEALQRVRDALVAMRVTAVVRQAWLSPADDLAALGFLGSPTILINGVDIEPAARAKADFAFVCRSYGASSVPPVWMIEAAIREALWQHGGPLHG
jgi:hypothetical protein